MTMKRVGERLLPSIAYGDAMGLPTETMSASEIAGRYGRLDHLIPPLHNPYYPGNFPAGTTSDDTQLSVAVAEGLLAADGFDIDAQAEAHLSAYHAITKTKNYKGEWSVRGWGGSTTASMERMAAGMSPLESGEPEGAGNGILMKMAPLVYWQVARQIDEPTRRQQYDELTTMTHDSEIARACTRLHGEVTHWLLEHPGASLDAFRTKALDVLASEPNADPKGRIERAMRFPVTSLTQLVGRYATGHTNGHYGFFVPSTVAMTYDVLVAARGDYTTAVNYAVNLGGDTDSIASIAGTMANAHASGEFVTPTGFEQVQDYERLTRLSHEFAQRALQNS